MAEKLTPQGLVCGLILDKEDGACTPAAEEEAQKTAPEKQPKKKRVTK